MIHPHEILEEHIDELVEMAVRSESDNYRSKKLIGSENIAKQYAEILYLENYGEWSEELVLWVKHHKKYGVWSAVLRADEPYLGGPPIIIFQDTDGKVIWYSN